MTTTVADIPSTRSYRGTAVALSIVGVIALAFVVAVALPYFRLDQAQFLDYGPRRWWLLVHVGTGIVALLTGPVQLWLGITDRRPALHRKLGTIYLAAVLVSSIAAYYLALNTELGMVFGSGLAGLATAWLVTSGFAFLAIKRQLFDQHKEWMIRSYVVTTGFLTFRVLFLLLERVAPVGTQLDHLGIAAWFCWSIPLLVTEAWLQGKKILAVKPV